MLIEKRKFKQWLCGFGTGHRKTESRIRDDNGFDKASHEYCTTCGKTLFLVCPDSLSQEHRDFILNKI